MFTDKGVTMQKIQIINASKRHITGEKFTLNYKFPADEGMLLYIIGGKGKLKLDNTLQSFSKGDFICCFGGEAFSYRFAAKCDGDLYFLRFKTCDAAPLEKTFGLEKGLYRIYDTAIAESSFKKLIKEYIVKPPFFEEKLSSLFYELLYNMALARDKQSVVKSLICELAEKIHGSFPENEIDVKEYADRAGLSKDRFSVIFKQYFGYPPYKYKLMLKMDEATELLKHTDLPIGKISEMLGFSNQLYFSSAYKKQVGKTPSDVRKI